MDRESLRIIIVQESEHFVVVRPPRNDTRSSELLEDLEFLLSRGFLPLTFTKLSTSASGLELDAIVCQKVRA